MEQIYAMKIRKGFYWHKRKLTIEAPYFIDNDLLKNKYSEYHPG